MSNDPLPALLKLQLPSEVKERISELMEKARHGSLSATESEELAPYLQISDLMKQLRTEAFRWIDRSCSD